MLIGTFGIHVTLHARIGVRAWKTDAGTVIRASTKKKIVFHSGEKRIKLLLASLTTTEHSLIARQKI